MNEIIKQEHGNEIVKNMDDIARAAAMMAQSGYFTDAKEAAQCGVKIMAGVEMGFGAFASMTGVHIIQGKPTIGANLMASAVKARGKYNYRVREMTAKRCEIEFFEGKESIGISEYSIEEATAAGLTGKDVWKKYPKNMLFSRAISNGIRWYAPDVFSGSTVYTPEELGAQVDDSGDVITIEPDDVKNEIDKSAQQNESQKRSKPPYPGDEILLQTFELPKDFTTILTAEAAENFCDRNGEPYGHKDNKTLYYMLDAIEQRFVTNNLSQEEKDAMNDKKAAIYLIFETRRKQAGY